jgi:LEA14-like dessication related protein
MHHSWFFVTALSSSLFFSACASGPVVQRAPRVEVSQFGASLITPEAMQFVGKVVIHNEMSGPLEIEKVDYEVDLHDNALLQDSFAELHRMKSHGRQTVTLPFQVAMKDVGQQIEDVLAEEGVRVTMRGTVFPVGFAPIPFSATRVIPVPRMPKVALDGVRGNPLDGEFTVFLRLENQNDFPMDFGSVETFLRLNGRKYDLLRTESSECMPAGGTGRVALSMRQTRSKGIGMIVNMAKNGSADFAVGGSLSFQTPHGRFLLPVELSSTAAAPGR